MRVLEIKKMSMGRLIESLLPMSLTLRPPVILSKRSTRKRLIPTKLHKMVVNPNRRPRCKMKRLMTTVKTKRPRSRIQVIKSQINKRILRQTMMKVKRRSLIAMRVLMARGRRIIKELQRIVRKPC